ncbi:MAG: DUF2160 domain-containing protein [Myxococcota bacterium]
MAWMAWIPYTGIFFGCLISMLIGMALWQRWSPTIERRGFLPMPTTRGDRLFIGLLAMAFIHMIWLAVSDAAPWPALAASAVVMAVIGRWG